MKMRILATALLVLAYIGINNAMTVASAPAAK